MTHVYRITTWDTHGNSHGVNRDETWSISRDKTFMSDDDALKYVRDKNMELPYFVNLTYGIGGVALDEFYNGFMNDPRYTHHCRWFVGKPPMDKIRAGLASDGVRTEN
jgi:hypothetical protein